MSRTYFLVILFLGCAAHFDWAVAAAIDLTQLSLEELMDLEVTTASRKEEFLFESPAAAYVLTGEEIRRSGFTNIADALRLVPGLQVGRIDAHTWAVTARGFNARFANKLLVLLDGRVIYTSLFSGVFWEVQDLVLEDVERIEVIRGPGATLWGANAVNGTINIITRNAKDTQGGLVEVGAGGEERGFGALRYGGALGAETHYRVYAKYLNRDRAGDHGNSRANDAWFMRRGGFRLDRDWGAEQSLTLVGDAYGGELDQTLGRGPAFEPPYRRMFDLVTDVEGGSLLGRWERRFAAYGSVRLGAFFDRSERRDMVIGEERNTLDLDFQHRMTFASRHDVVWGFGYRFTSDDIDSTFITWVDPPQRDVQIVSAFAQDEIRFADERLRLTVGIKFEHNDYTGVEVQPNVRLLWLPRAQHAVWGAVSRAVRLPTRSESDGRFIQDVIPLEGVADSLLTIVELRGDPGFESEEVLAFELGYRTRPRDDLSLDLSIYYNRYDNLRTGEPQTVLVDTSGIAPRLTLPIIADNRGFGETFGLEKAVDWQVRRGWRLRAGYSFLHIDTDVDEDSQSPESANIENNNPRHQFNLRSALDLSRGITFDLNARRVGGLKPRRIAGYLTLDARLAWQPRSAIELSLTGLDLLDSPRREFNAELIEIIETDVQRSLYGAVRWSF